MLRETLAEASTSDSSGTTACDMCAEALIEKILLQQQNDSSGAKAALDAHGDKLSRSVREVGASSTSPFGQLHGTEAVFVRNHAAPDCVEQLSRGAHNSAVCDVWNFREVQRLDKKVRRSGLGRKKAPAKSAQAQSKSASQWTPQQARASSPATGAGPPQLTLLDSLDRWWRATFANVTATHAMVAVFAALVLWRWAAPRGQRYGALGDWQDMRLKPRSL